MKKRERGIALPTVLVCLVALTALGLAMTISTQNEVVVSGVQQRSMESFHAADGGINYALGMSSNFDDPSDTEPFTTDGLGMPFKATVGVAFQPPARLPPPGLRVSALKVVSFYFLISSTGKVTAPAASQNSVTAVEMQASKLGPNASGVNGP